MGEFSLENTIGVGTLWDPVLCQVACSLVNCCGWVKESLVGQPEETSFCKHIAHNREQARGAITDSGVPTCTLVDTLCNCVQYTLVSHPQQHVLRCQALRVAIHPRITRRSISIPESSRSS
mmetsp:Transcript_9976/g.16327  ORF Transcript_9976/g.16327 Transcript_9976/m.16327 type:complete len:121 (+) Transcript_9976:80-442(+)